MNIKRLFIDVISRIDRQNNDMKGYKGDFEIGV